VTKSLSDAQVEHFRTHGWLAPLTAIDAETAADYVRRIEAYEAAIGQDVNRSLKIKGHLAFPWLVELGRNPKILDAVEDLIGPDIMLFGASVFAKPGNDKSYVSWHQDSAYFGLEPHDEVTAWVALTESNRHNGALQVLPGSHQGRDMQHEETYAEDNMLARGQAIAIDDDSEAVTLELEAGQFSLHHERTAHGSKTNKTSSRRVGFAFFFIPAHVRSTLGRRTAILVRGTDRYGNWDADPVPAFDMDPVAMAAVHAAWGQYRDGEVKQAAAE
jgi:hypothetical protein